MDTIQLAKEHAELCTQIRRDLHQIPELELHLPKTVAYVKQRLDEFGIPYCELVDGNALVALIEGRTPGKCLAIRADMDALPIQEETGASYASQHEGRMHACGHDGHTAMLLTTAKILNDYKQNLQGSVKLLFQPGEEVPGGAEPMILEGALENPHVDCVIGLHAGRIDPQMPPGALGFRKGALMASMDIVSITVQGKGGHGATPHLTVDPIVIAGEILMGLQKIVSREISPVARGLISICKINGGTTQNIIPDTVEMLGTVRALDEQTRDHLEEAISRIAKGIAQSYGGDAQVDYRRYYPVVQNDPEFTEYVENLAKELFPDCVYEVQEPSMGGEDVAFFLKERPGTFFFLSNAKIYEDGTVYPHHNCRFDLDESEFYKGISLFLKTAFDYLSGEDA